MNIIMFTNTFLPHVGGVAHSVATFAEKLFRHGHRILIVCPRFPEDDQDSKIPFDIYRVPALQNFNGSDFSVRIPLPFALVEKIEAFQPDIIHSHHPFLMGDSALRTARKYDLPLIFTHHTMYEQYTHYVPFDSKPMKRFVISLSTEYANLCNAVIAPSRSVADLIRGRGVTRPVYEIPTGVDVEFFRSGDRMGKRRKLGIPDQASVIGHVGRLAPEKNLAYLAQSVIAFLRSAADGFFLVTGDGPSLAEIKSQFEAAGLRRRLILTGKKTGTELRDIYHAMDIFVFASVSETQGMVLVEAMAAGKSVIALDAPGAREVVRDNENGRLLEQNAPPEEFGRAIASWAESPRRAKTWQQNAGKTAESFSRQQTAQSLAEVYDTVITHHTLKQRSPEDLLSWNNLLKSLKTEWDLLSQKTTAMVTAVKPDEKARE